MGNIPSKLIAVIAKYIRSPVVKRTIFIVGLLITAFIYLQLTFFPHGFATSFHVPLSHQDVPGVTKAFVVSSMKKDDTKWIPELFRTWKAYRYVTDDPSAEYTVPKNKGREAMVYLTWVSLFISLYGPS